jgi:hypothetical protein
MLLSKRRQPATRIVTNSPFEAEQSELPRIAEDIFALGSAIFEVTEWRLPHHDVDDDEVGVLMVKDILPDPSFNNPAAAVIHKC